VRALHPRRRAVVAGGGLTSAVGHYQILMSSSNRYTGDRLGIEWAVQGSGNHYFYPCGDGGGTDPYNLGPDPFTDKS